MCIVGTQNDPVADPADDRLGRAAKPEATREPESKPPEPRGIYTTRDYVIVLWVDP